MIVGDRVRLVEPRAEIPTDSVGVVLGVIFCYPPLVDDIAVKFDGKSLVVRTDEVELVEAE